MRKPTPATILLLLFALGAPGAAQEPPRTHYHLLPAPTVLPAAAFFGYVGQVTPISGAADGENLGSGNQTYHALVATGLGHGWMAFGFVQNNDDPSWGLVAGARRGRELTGIGGGVRRAILGGAHTGGARASAARGAVASSRRASLATELTLGYFSVKSDPGFFNAEAEETRRHHLAASASAMLGLPLGRAWSATLVPSIVWLPEENSGAPFYGWTGLLGLGVDGPLWRRLRAFATYELPTGPGTNWVDRDFAFRRIPTWSLGATWDRSPRVGVTAFLTNSAGGSPHTRHLTHLGEAPAQWGLRLHWAPTEPEPEDHREAFSGDADGGIALPAAAALPTGTISVRGSLDAEEGNGLRLRVAASRSLEFVMGVGRSPDLDARPELGIDLGGTPHYRLGAKLTLLDQGAGGTSDVGGTSDAGGARDAGAGRDAGGEPGAGTGSPPVAEDAATEGAPLTVAARVTVGRESGTQTGYLLAELPIHRRFGERFAVGATLAVVQSGGDTPVAFGLSGVLGRADGFQALLEPTILLTGQPTLWTAGLRLPRRGPLRAEAYATTAHGIMGLSRFLGNPDRVRLGIAMELRFGILR